MAIDFQSSAPLMLPLSLANRFWGEQYFTKILIQIDQLGVVMIQTNFVANPMYSVGGVGKKFFLTKF